jgi:colanic acid/amylovoran biosynthesis protein
MNDRYIVIPGCCDLNRGDQALGWETSRIAQDAGFIGSYSVLAERGEPIEQSKEEGYEILVPLLEHPSRKFQNKDNIIYDKVTKLKWGFVALKDFTKSFCILKSEKVRQRVLKKNIDEEYSKTLKCFYECKAIFMKGGGLIQSHGGLTSTYATYYRLYHIFLAQALDKPVYILPNSFGPFEGPMVRWMAELGIDIPCFPDLAFYLQNGTETPKKLRKEMNIPEDRQVVAITMRPYRFPNSDNPAQSYETFKCEMREFIVWLYETGYMPLVIEHTFAITTHENDGDCIRDVLKNIDERFYRLMANRNINCRELKSIYGCCDYIIGTRFHSLIFSLSNLVPGIAISYDGYKSVGIMKDMNLERYVVDISEVKAERLCEMFTDMVEKKEEIRENIRNYIDRANQKRKELIKLLNSSSNNRR